LRGDFVLALALLARARAEDDFLAVFLVGLAFAILFS
jgi:hypothetical protein